MRENPPDVGVPFVIWSDGRRRELVEINRMDRESEER